jgi:integrase
MGIQVKAWKGAWRIFINHKGQRKAKRVGTGKEGQKAALAVAEKIQARLMLGELPLKEEAQPQETTLREYAEQWLATDVALRQKPGTVETYRGVLRNHWLPELGSLPLSAITRERIKTILQRKLMAGMKANAARSMFSVLRTCLHSAVAEERIMSNPAARVGKFIGRPRTEVEIFTSEELARLLRTPLHQDHRRRLWASYPRHDQSGRRPVS